MKEKRLEDIQRAANLQESARLHSVRQHRQIAGVFSNPDIHVISKTFDYLRVLEIDCQAWQFAATDERKEFIKQKGCTAKSGAAIVEWLIRNYKWPIKADPIPSWDKRLSKCKSETNRSFGFDALLRLHETNRKNTEYNHRSGYGTG